MATSNYELIEICNKNKIPLVGVYSKDQLPNTLTNGCYIINLQDLYDKTTGEQNSGTHWTGLYIFKNNQAIYFDSFGFPPPNILVQLLKKQQIKCQINLKEIQNINSSTCGKYVIAFLIYVSKYSVNVEPFISMFSDDPEKNNKLLQSFLSHFSINIY